MFTSYKPASAAPPFTGTVTIAKELSTGDTLTQGTNRIYAQALSTIQIHTTVTSLRIEQQEKSETLILYSDSIETTHHRRIQSRFKPTTSQVKIQLRSSSHHSLFKRKLLPLIHFTPLVFSTITILIIRFYSVILTTTSSLFYCKC